MEAEDLADEAEEAERAAAEAAHLAAEAAKKATDEAARKAAEEAEKKALAEAMANKEKKLRANLKGATKSRKVDRLEGSIKEAKNAKMPGRLYCESLDPEHECKQVYIPQNDGCGTRTLLKRGCRAVAEVLSSVIQWDTGGLYA